jgi:signal transduction histidine kinase
MALLNVGWLAALCLVLLNSHWSFAAERTPPTTTPQAVPAQWHTRATLLMASGSREVTLPHQLEAGDIPPGGGRVRYRVSVAQETQPLALSVYIKKMSRSGRVMLNGNPVGACGPLELEQLRCQHQPQFFTTDPSQWRDGSNVIEVEIYANPQQANGLSALVIGSTESLYRDHYRPEKLWRVDMIDALSWLNFGLALLSLLFFRVFHAEKLYLWFGLTCMMNGISNLNILVTAPFIHFALFDWLIFTSRIVFSCFLGLALLSFYQRDRPWHTHSLLLYATFCALAIGWTGNDPKVVSVLYLPLQLAAIALAVAAVLWAMHSMKTSHWVMALAFLINPVAGAFDLLRLRGQANFEGVYLLVYTSALTLVLVGMGLIGLLAVAMRTTRDFSQQLENRVAEREATLRDIYDRVRTLENARIRAEERDRMMRDIHDGFMSTLAITRVALQAGHANLEQAAKYIGDCIDDLRLVLDATGQAAHSLDDLLANFRHRLDARLRGVPVEVSWHIELDGMPELVPSTLLQIMRIVHEGCNNALRHSRCTELTIVARWDGPLNTLTVEVNDNGQGIAEATTPWGRGLNNMRSRAIAIQGQLQINSGPEGTQVQLTLRQQDPP